MRKDHSYWTYIMTNRSYTSLYTGMTGDLVHRVWQHKFDPRGFVARYRTSLLVYCVEFGDVHDAIAWEKRIKNMHRAEKIAHIEAENPSWYDLAANWYAAPAPAKAGRPSPTRTVASPAPPDPVATG